MSKSKYDFIMAYKFADVYKNETEWQEAFKLFCLVLNYIT